MKNKGRNFPKKPPQGGDHKARREDHSRSKDVRTNRPEHKKHEAQRAVRADLYGFHAVREAWLNPARKIKALYITEAAHDSFQETLSEATRAGLARPSPTKLEKHQLEAALPDGAVHQGLGLVCAALPEIDITEMMASAVSKDRSVLVMLDQVTDPHNIGAILRSACAFGASGLIMQRKHAPDLSGSAGGLLAKTACGALEHVPVAYETNLSRTIETLQEGGYFIYGLDERGQDIGEINIADKAVLVLGAEGPGLRHLVKEHCDVLVRLPMDGPMPSINVSNAAAVALYALANTSYKP